MRNPCCSACGLFILLGATLALHSRCSAGTAAFSADSSHVFLVQGNSLVDVDFKSHRAVPVPLNIEGHIAGVCSSPNGPLLVTDKALWRVDERGYQLSRLCDVPQGMEGEDVAFDGQSNSILVSCSQTGDDAGGWSLFLLEADATELATVRIRRLRYVQAPVFDTSGQLYFTAEGDIWHGSIEREEESHSLTAIRIAPVATRETQNATPAQMGAQELALCGDRIFAAVRRMGGSGWGETVSLNIPATSPDVETVGSDDAEDIVSEFKERIIMYSAALSSVRILGNNGGVYSYLCASVDGQKAFFATMRRDASDSTLASRQFWTVEQGGDPIPIEIDFSGIDPK